MTVEAYPYDAWTMWPEEDVREWAGEIAFAFSLEGYAAGMLLDEMLSRAGHWREPPEAIRYPIKMSEDQEALCAAAYDELHAAPPQVRDLANSIALEIFEQNRRLNRPRLPPEFVPTKWERKQVVGSGLTQKVYWVARREGPMLRESKVLRSSMRWCCYSQRLQRASTLTG